ncbi:MAG: hypothetical protein KBB01_02955 [Candidatus Omnitrophica bacterium]|nr:hypothetical protein [Candidatus Omnitrophota bacterium]
MHNKTIFEDLWTGADLYAIFAEGKENPKDLLWHLNNVLGLQTIATFNGPKVIDYKIIHGPERI